jgi:hypothetical protein
MFTVYLLALVLASEPSTMYYYGEQNKPKEFQNDLACQEKLKEAVAEFKAQGMARNQDYVIGCVEKESKPA